MRQLLELVMLDLEMSTLAEIEAALPTLSAEELRRIEILLGQLQRQRSIAKPWMQLAGSLSGEAEELHRIARVVEREFERVEPDDWR